MDTAWRRRGRSRAVLRRALSRRRRARRSCRQVPSRSRTAWSSSAPTSRSPLTPQDDTDGAWFNYTDYEHNALRLFRVGVTADVRLTDRVSVLTEIRSENGDAVKPYALYVRVRPWRDRPIDIQAGRIPPTFGAFARRDYGAGQSADRLPARLSISDRGPP